MEERSSRRQDKSRCSGREIIEEANRQAGKIISKAEDTIEREKKRPWKR